MKPVRKRYPLDPAEERTLALDLVLTQLILLALGAAGSFVVGLVEAGSIDGALSGGFWWRSVLASLASRPPGETAASALLLLAVLLAVGGVGERLAWNTMGGRRSIVESRRGVNGEIARMRVPVFVVLMCVSGFAEELLFRYVLAGGVASALELVVPRGAATLVALAVSCIAFWLVHERYRDPFTTTLTLALGLALGLAYLFSDSLAVVFLAHAAYDVADLVAERVKMRLEDDYFHGPAPARAILDMLEERRGGEGHAAEEEMSGE